MANHQLCNMFNDIVHELGLVELPLYSIVSTPGLTNTALKLLQDLIAPSQMRTSTLHIHLPHLTLRSESRLAIHPFLQHGNHNPKVYSHPI